MAGQYSYPPPPPPPSSASTGYPYGQPQTYSPAPPRGGGRGRGQHQGPSRGDYGSPYGSYPQQDYNSPHTASPYNHQAPSNYWSGSPQMNPQVHNAPLPQTNYHPNYAPQGYAPQPHATYPTSAYPTNGQRPSYPPAYNPPSNDYSATQSWSDTSSPFSSHSTRGGRGGYSDRGGHRPEQASGQVLRMGFDQNAGHGTQASNGYAPPYPPPAPQHHSLAPYQQPPYHSYPPAAAPSYLTSSQNSHSFNNRGRVRDGFSSGRGRGGHNDRGDKFRNRGGQRSYHDHNSAQKSDHSAKKKKRKTNTLGLTPGDEESDDGSGDEEKHLTDLLGPDVPVISDLADWIKERKANFPTKARIAAKQAAEQAKRAEVGDAQKPTSKIDKDVKELEKLKRKMAKIEDKLKRKREADDEGDDMRVNEIESSLSSSDDEKPESLSTRKPSHQPPPPMNRADPTNHCKYYATGGTCGKKGKCRFKHDPAVREKALQEQAMNGGRMTLKQLLLRNDKHNDDLAVLQSIATLKATGKLPPSGSLPPTNPTTSVLIHPLPAKVEYVSQQSQPPPGLVSTQTNKKGAKKSLKRQAQKPSNHRLDLRSASRSHPASTKAYSNVSKHDPFKHSFSKHGSHVDVMNYRPPVHTLLKSPANADLRSKYVPKHIYYEDPRSSTARDLQRSHVSPYFMEARPKKALGCLPKYDFHNMRGSRWRQNPLVRSQSGSGAVRPNKASKPESKKLRVPPRGQLSPSSSISIKAEDRLEKRSKGDFYTNLRGFGFNTNF
ncbi:uncharacterized protein BCR38DRAFT_486510 [Pseudomassariella vexata]|uniref:C3H1-type domain-containing protein n=1 Tax=Pseudomassariella vexata TaxID=1141098 RepID=A0A1Y2DSK0_9PEZI|nr:uncharacterized protein BCR38DRAFT_486510 [Pseudomassariella vexata]ORY62238.1 hypothetical protein BCR38DRAFT_486510 [Pseudomassariella vexata]